MLSQAPSDILLRLLGTAEEIRDILREKSDQEKSDYDQLKCRPFPTPKTAQEPNEASHQTENPHEERNCTAQELLIPDTASAKTDDESEYRKICHEVGGSV